VRRLSLILLAFVLVAVPTALAAPNAAGDGVLELRNVSGTVQIGTTTNFARGAVWGQLDNGYVSIFDPHLSNGRVYVSGWDRKPLIKDTPEGRLSLYAGKDLRFRITGGLYKLVATGSGLDLTAVGVGTAYLNGDPRALDDGAYSVDDGKWVPVLPVLPSLTSTGRPQGVVAPFGDQPSPPSQP